MSHFLRRCFTMGRCQHRLSDPVCYGCTSQLSQQIHQNSHSCWFRWHRAVKKFCKSKDMSRLMEWDPCYWWFHPVIPYFDETVYDRKTTYSLNCQICTNYIHCSVLIQLTACCHATWLMCHQLWSWPSRQCAWCTCLLGNGDYKQSRRVTPSITLGLGQ